MAFTIGVKYEEIFIMPRARSVETKKETASPGRTKGGSPGKNDGVKRRTTKKNLPSETGITGADYGRTAQDAVIHRLIRKQAFLKKIGDKRKRYYLSDDVTTVGSGKSSMLVIHDPAVAVLHARIVHKKGEYILFEHEMTGFSYVNGVEVTECSLRDGDVLRFGNTSFGFFHRSSSWYGGF